MLEESPSPNSSQFSPRVGYSSKLSWVSLEAIDIPSLVRTNLVNSVAVQVSSQNLNSGQSFGFLKPSRLGVILVVFKRSLIDKQ